MAALADFIDEAREEIAQAWEEFARTLEPGASRLYLRDHIEEILKAIVADMRTAQSAKQQVAKSEGNAEQGPLALIGQTHASERIETGFRLDQVMAEYRALRASVLGLWESRGGNADSSGITRFNEAIDEALTEAVAIYVEKTERYRDESLGILGHDLRNPLGAIHMGATLLLKTETLDDRSARVAGRILTGAKRMERLVRDLLDLTRTRLGKGIPIVTIAMDLEPLCGQIVAELEAVHPDRHLRYECEGDLRGEWDSDRLGQVLSNLVGNALEHGAEGGPVDLIARGRVDDILVEVHNGGPPIPPAALPTLFEPMVRHPPQRRQREIEGRTRTGPPHRLPNRRGPRGKAHGDLERGRRDAVHGAAAAAVSLSSRRPNERAFATLRLSINERSRVAPLRA